MNFEIDFFSKYPFSKVLKGYKKIVEEFVELSVLHINKLKNAETIELSFTICNDKYIREYNKNYRGKDKPTNVLSFPTVACLINDKFYRNEDYILLGDIILSADTLIKEANEQNKTVHDHFAHLIVHSTLHLMGYDHEVDEEAEEMERLEAEILAKKNIKSPYHMEK